MRFNTPTKGGGHGTHPPHPNVWTPAGGWWVNPPNWKRNTAIAFGVGAVLTAYVFAYSTTVEHRPVAPKLPIPSAMWSKVPPVDKT